MPNGCLQVGIGESHDSKPSPKIFFDENDETSALKAKVAALEARLATLTSPPVTPALKLCNADSINQSYMKKGKGNQHSFTPSSILMHGNSNNDGFSATPEKVALPGSKSRPLSSICINSKQHPNGSSSNDASHLFLVNELEALRTKCVELETRIEAAEREAEIVKVDKLEAIKALESLEEENVKLQDELTEMLNIVEQQQSQISSLEARAARAERELSGHESEEAILRQALQETDEYVEELYEKLMIAEEELARFRSISPEMPNVNRTLFPDDCTPVHNVLQCMDFTSADNGSCSVDNDNPLDSVVHNLNEESQNKGLEEIDLQDEECKVDEIVEHPDPGLKLLTITPQVSNSQPTYSSDSNSNSQGATSCISYEQLQGTGVPVCRRGSFSICRIPYNKNDTEHEANQSSGYQQSSQHLSRHKLYRTKSQQLNSTQHNSSQDIVPHQESSISDRKHTSTPQTQQHQQQQQEKQKKILFQDSLSCSKRSNHSSPLLSSSRANHQRRRSIANHELLTHLNTALQASGSASCEYVEPSVKLRKAESPSQNNDAEEEQDYFGQQQLLLKKQQALLLLLLEKERVMDQRNELGFGWAIWGSAAFIAFAAVATAVYAFTH